MAVSCVVMKAIDKWRVLGLPKREIDLWQAELCHLVSRTDRVVLIGIQKIVQVQLLLQTAVGFLLLLLQTAIGFLLLSHITPQSTRQSEFLSRQSSWREEGDIVHTWTMLPMTTTAKRGWACPTSITPQPTRQSEFLSRQSSWRELGWCFAWFFDGDIVYTWTMLL